MRPTARRRMIGAHPADHRSASLPGGSDVVHHRDPALGRPQFARPRRASAGELPVLEPAAQEIADATSRPPFLYELGPSGARKVLDDIQAAPIAKLDVDERWITVPADVGDVAVRIVKPAGATDVLPAVLYVHGGGWVLGNAGTHDRLVRELAVGARAAIVFVEYDRVARGALPRRHRAGVRDGALDRPGRRRPRGWTRPASPSRATPSAATWPPPSPSSPSSGAT